MRRSRNFVAIVVIAALALAVAVPGAAAADLFAPLVAVWVEFQPTLVVVTAIDTNPLAEQPLALLTLNAFRAPPAALFV